MINQTKTPLLLSIAAVLFLTGPLTAATDGPTEAVLLDFESDEEVTEGKPLTGAFVGNQTSAVVSMGQVIVVHGAAELSGGVDITPGAIAIKIPEILPLSPLELSFQLSQPKDQSDSNYLFEIRLRDLTKGEEYTIKLSPNFEFFGSSGVNSFNDGGELIAGNPEVRLNSDTRPQFIKIVFDPDGGVQVLKDEEEIAAFRNFKRLDKIDRIELVNSPESGGVIRWVIDDVRVSAQLRATEK